MILLKNNKVTCFLTWPPTDFSALIMFKLSPAAHRIHLPAGQRTSTHSAQRRKLTAGQLSRFHQKRPMASKFAECKLGGLSRVSQKQSRNSRNRFRLSGATYHKDRSTRLWKTSQIKRLKACVGAWNCRWILRTFTVTMEFWHLIIS